MRLALLAAGTLLIPAAAGAHHRQPGDRYLRCDASHGFPLLTVSGPPAQLATRRGGRLAFEPWPETRGEAITGSIEVDADGSLAHMEMRWDQQRGGWPESWRTDVHPLYLEALFMQPEPRPGGGNFDPAALEMRLIVVSEERLREPLLFRLWRDGESHNTILLSLAAGVEVDYYRRRTATVAAHWRDIAHLSEGEPFLVWRLGRSASPVSPVLASGALNLSFIPRLFDEFRAAEARLLEAAAKAPQDCEPQVEPEHDPVITGSTGRR